MDFSISEEQRDLIARLEAFCNDNVRETEVRRWIAEGNVPDAFMITYYEEGFGKLGLPEELGGIPASILTRVLVLERLAKHAGGTLPIQALMTCEHYYEHLATKEQAAFLHRITSQTGRPAFSLAVTEPQMGSNLFDIRTTAVEEGDCFVLNGLKSFVNLGQYAPYVMLFAQDVSLNATDIKGKSPLSFFIVSRDAPGLDTFPLAMVGQRLVPTADIEFNDVRIPKESVVGKRGCGADGLLLSLDYARLYACATTVGMAEAALMEAMEHALKRKTSKGVAIISFQRIQDRIVDMQVKIDAMRGLLYKTACALDASKEHARLDIALLKRFVPTTAMEVADSAMQILGGMGYLASSRVARIWEECRGNRIILGTDEIMTAIALDRIITRANDEYENKVAWRY